MVNLNTLLIQNPNLIERYTKAKNLKGYAFPFVLGDLFYCIVEFYLKLDNNCQSLRR